MQPANLRSWLPRAASTFRPCSSSSVMGLILPWRTAVTEGAHLSGHASAAAELPPCRVQLAPARAGAGDDVGAQAAERVGPRAGQGWVVGQLGAADRNVTGEARGAGGNGVEDRRLAAPRAADDDEFWVGEGHGGSDCPGDGLADEVASNRSPGLRAGGRGQETLHVDSSGAGLPEAQFAEYLNQGHRLAVRAGGDQVGDLAGHAVMSAYDLAVADDSAAQSFAEEYVGKVGQCSGSGVVAFGLCGPVHVVVDADRPVDVRRQDLDRIKFADQKRRVGRW